MHLYESVLASSEAGQVILGAGIVLAAGGTALGLRRLDYEQMPRVAVLSSAFFVASLIHVPIGGAPVHLVLGGLMGLVLGWAAFPALLIALLLQAVFFQYGGLLAVGINTVMMALPAVVCYYLFGAAVRGRSEGMALGAAVAAGALAVVLASLINFVLLLALGEDWQRLAQLTLVANLPVAAIDAAVTGGAVMFLRKVRPETLEGPPLAPGRVEIPHA